MSDLGHIVFVSQLFPPEKGGNASRIHDTARELRREGWKVTVLAPPPSVPPGAFDRSWRRIDTDTIDGITVHRLWSCQPLVEDPGMVRRLLYYLLFGIHAMLWLLWNVRRYDIVITSTPPISTGAPGLLADVLGKGWVVDIRDLWIDASISLGYLSRGSALERISRRFQRTVLHRANRIAVTTDTLQECVRAEYGETLAGRIMIVPNGVDTDRFTPFAEPPGRLSESSVNGSVALVESNRPAEPQGGSSGSTDQPVIVYTGNLGSAQALDIVVEAMAYLDHETAVLRLVGGGDRESSLRELAAECGVADRVEFVGVVDRVAVPAHLHAATIGIAPLKENDALRYAMPTKVYEYLACGLPTVVTGSGEIERFIDVSGGGVHAENDPEQLARHLDCLLEHDDHREQLGAAGREFVIDHYDREAIAKRLSAALMELREAND